MGVFCNNPFFSLSLNNTLHFQAVMRRCGHNPTDIEVADIINKVHDDTGGVGFEVRNL